MRLINLHLKEEYPILGEHNCDPVLSAYLPDNQHKANVPDFKRPVLLICPGGGYTRVSPREAEPIALRFLSEGYNIFILTYSCKPNKFPTQIREVAAAMEMIYRNAEEWSNDTNRVAIMGFSAGGHLAAHYSTSFDCAEVREIFPDSKPVNTSLLCYSVLSADPSVSHPGSFRVLSGHEILTKEDIQKLSCDLLVSEKTPPAFLWATTTDKTVPVMNTLLYAQALTKYKIPFAMHIYPYGKHGLATADLETNLDVEEGAEGVTEWFDEAKKWLKITL